MEQKNHATFAAARKALSSEFDEAYESRLFLRNYGWMGAAVVVFVAAIVAEAKPEAAWMISSNAGRAAHGPFCPNPVAEA